MLFRIESSNLQKEIIESKLLIGEQIGSICDLFWLAKNIGDIAVDQTSA